MFDLESVVKSAAEKAATMAVVEATVVAATFLTLVAATAMAVMTSTKMGMVRVTAAMMTATATVAAVSATVAAKKKQSTKSCVIAEHRQRFVLVRRFWAQGMEDRGVDKWRSECNYDGKNKRGGKTGVVGRAVSAMKAFFSVL